MPLTRRSRDDDAVQTANARTGAHAIGGVSKAPSTLTWMMALVLGLAIGAGGMLGAAKLGYLDHHEADVAQIQGSFADIAELATEEYDFKGKQTFTDDDLDVLGLSLPFFATEYSVTYEGTVKAGLRDISSVSLSKNDVAHTVTATAPSVQILATKIDPSTVEGSDTGINLFKNVSVSEVATFLADNESTAEKQAVEAGVLKKAEQNATELLTHQVKLGLMGSDQEDYTVKVTFKDAAGK